MLCAFFTLFLAFTPACYFSNCLNEQVLRLFISYFEPCGFGEACFNLANLSKKLKQPSEPLLCESADCDTGERAVVML